MRLIFTLANKCNYMAYDAQKVLADNIARERKGFINCFPFETLEIAKRVIGSGIEVKFVKPPQPVMWENSLTTFLLTAKVLRTLIARYIDEKKNYNVLYKSSFFYKETSFKIIYNSNTYTFEVITGLKFRNGQSQIKNEVQIVEDLYKKAESYIYHLIKTMKFDLPQARYEELMVKYDRLKSLKTFD